MAKANVFILSIFVIASLSSLSHGLSLNGLQIGALEVKGLLRCTLEANLNAPPVTSQTVFLECAGSTSSLGQAVTDLTGTFRIVVKILDTLIFDPSRCYVKVILPVATCSVFPPDGALTASISLVSVVQSSTGNIASFITGTFVRSVL